MTMCACSPAASPGQLCLITQRSACAEPLPTRVEKVLTAGAAYVMLREKDLPEPELFALAKQLARVADDCGGRLIINTNISAAEEVRAWGLQLPLADFRRLHGDPRLASLSVGVSVHSLAEALEAQALGADRLLAGHVFPTACKAGAPGRGLDFLRELKSRLRIPVWAVGGIGPAEAPAVLAAGASALCVMSSLMATPQPEQLTKAYLKAIHADIYT